jgi:hypothetical protein
MTAVLPRGQEDSLVRRIVTEFIVPTLEPGTALIQDNELHRSLVAEMALAQQTRGEPRNTLEPQDAPRR